MSAKKDLLFPFKGEHDVFDVSKPSTAGAGRGKPEITKPEPSSVLASVKRFIPLIKKENELLAEAGPSERGKSDAVVVEADFDEDGDSDDEGASKKIITPSTAGQSEEDEQSGCEIELIKVDPIQENEGLGELLTGAVAKK